MTNESRRASHEGRIAQVQGCLQGDGRIGRGLAARARGRNGVRIQAFRLMGILVSAGAFALGCARARTSTSTGSGAPSLPAGLALPAGEVPAFELRARGSQDYECRESRDAPGVWQWVFVAPEAELFDVAGRPVGKHYAGPT